MVPRRISQLLCAALIATAVPTLPVQPVQAAPSAHRHFRTAIYIAVGDVKELADRVTFDREFARASSQSPDTASFVSLAGRRS